MDGCLRLPIIPSAPEPISFSVARARNDLRLQHGRHRRLPADRGEELDPNSDAAGKALDRFVLAMVDRPHPVFLRNALRPSGRDIGSLLHIVFNGCHPLSNH